MFKVSPEYITTVIFKTGTGAEQVIFEDDHHAFGGRLGKVL